MKARWKNSIRVLAIVMICFAMIFSNISLCKVNKTSHNKNVLAASSTTLNDTEEDLCELKAATENVSLKKGSTVLVNFYFKEIMETLIFGLEYDNTVFEELTEDDITMDGASPDAGKDRPWGMSSMDVYNEGNKTIGSFYVSRYISSLSSITSKEGYVCTFHLKVKADATNTTVCITDSNGASKWSERDYYGKAVECVIQDGGNYTQENTTAVTSYSKHLYEDCNYKNSLSGDGIRIYANGGKVKQNGITKNYKQKQLFTDILASYKYSTDKKGKLVSGLGSVQVGITSSNIKPVLNAKGKIVDAQAAKIATASINNGCITVTAKNIPGNVYLWVMDTGDDSESEDAYTCCPVKVLSAPTAITAYLSDITETDIQLFATYKNGNQIIKATNATYTPVVPDNLKDYVTVTKVNNEKYQLSINNQNATKKITGNISFVCNENGKKALFPVTIIP